MIGAAAASELRSYFAGRPEVEAVILFGSAARGDAGPHSDVDLGVLLSHEQAERGVNLSQLVTDVMEILQRQDVDVVILNSAPPLLLHRVIRDGHLLHAISDRVVAEFQIRAMQRYVDTKPLRDLQAARRKAQLESMGKQAENLDPEP